MKTLHIVKTSKGATWALRQMRELVNLGVDVHAVMPLDGPLTEQYRDAGIIVHDGQFSISLEASHHLPGLFRSFRRLVDQVRPDLIHSHFVGTTLMMRMALGKNHTIPRVFQVPGPLHLEHPVFRRGEIATAGKSDHWIGSCQWTCNRYRDSGVLDERIHLAYYGTDIDTFTPQPTGTLRAALGLGPEAPIVGMVAYMYAPKRFLGQKRGLKGHEDLIDALAIVQKRIPDVQGVFIGGAWAGADAYEAQVRSYGEERLGPAAHFMGTQPHVPRLYADINVVAHPSHSENVGGAGESLLLAVPTITTDVGGFPDLVTSDETGWLVQPKRPDQLAEAIIDALQNPSKAAQLAVSGQRNARQMLDVRNSARDVLSIYQRLLSAQ